MARPGAFAETALHTIRQEKYRWIVTPTLIFLLTRALLFGVAYVGRVAFLEEVGTGPWHAAPDNLLLDVWDRWDSAFYRAIARDGYGAGPAAPDLVAFFPGYPLLTALAGTIFPRLTLAGIVASNLCLWGALLFLYRLTNLEFGDHATAGRAVLYIAVFPTAFFFGAVYGESAFLLFSVATVYFARRRRWFPAGVLGACASATRLVGVFLFGVVLLEWLWAHGWAFRDAHRLASWQRLARGVRADWAGLLAVGLIPLGLLGYMLFLYLRFGDPLAFVTVQGSFRAYDIVNPLRPIARDFLATVRQSFRSGNTYLWRVSLDVLAAVGALALVPFVWRRLGAGYALYVLLAVLLPAGSNSVTSMTRYVLVLFPLFMILAWWGRRPLVDRAITVGFTILLGVLTAVFANWIFIA